jgi:hypothetical protein
LRLVLLEHLLCCGSGQTRDLQLGFLGHFGVRGGVWGDQCAVDGVFFWHTAGPGG